MKARNKLMSLGVTGGQINKLVKLEIKMKDMEKKRRQQLG
jgi:flagellar biogenesis protein FliO